MAKYTYTIFDANPNDSSGTAWPDHDDVEIESDSDDEAIETVRATMSVEAAGLNASDGYDVGQRLYALVWDADEIIVGEPTYELTAEDLGVEIETAEERVERAAKEIDATELDDGRWAHRDDAMGRWYVVTADELAELCDYLDHDDEQISKDAYSHWCAGTSAEEMPRGWSPELVESIAKRVKGLSFVTPPENQGQIVIVSYACDADYIYARAIDQSDRSVSVSVYEHPETEEDWGPQNGAPRTGELVATVEAQS